MTTHPITRPTFAEQKRLRAERDRAAVAAASPPDPQAINYFRCRRCERLMRARGIADECHRCIDGAIRAWGLGPMCGEVSGT